jgi:hypothetical protein
MVAVVLISVFCVSSQPAAADQRVRNSNDLFYNYYVPPTWGGGVGAQLYLSPRPAPPLVGQTYITYQPLMPHEFLYRHSRAYYNCHPDGKMTRTRVSWR